MDAPDRWSKLVVDKDTGIIYQISGDIYNGNYRTTSISQSSLDSLANQGVDFSFLDRVDHSWINDQFAVLNNTTTGAGPGNYPDASSRNAPLSSPSYPDAQSRNAPVAYPPPLTGGLNTGGAGPGNYPDASSRNAPVVYPVPPPLTGGLNTGGAGPGNYPDASSRNANIVWPKQTAVPQPQPIPQPIPTPLPTLAAMPIATKTPVGPPNYNDLRNSIMNSMPETPTAPQVPSGLDFQEYLRNRITAPSLSNVPQR